MKTIQNTNVAFRCPNDLKERLELFAVRKNLHLSSIIRSACSDWLKQKEREEALAEEDVRFDAFVKEMLRYTRTGSDDSEVYE